ncbi:hypothetical protein P153DRAFT_395087 [Dothidotthia symphoricarpi CBS 119687]|uniref:HMG box domain-containing protein n=1 Tax=Dothidotthia symphoricarpi CBS 119687 TaxID=1392245 RepID=A0A6A6AIZ7_9PLEO|nr:uncharacterized protein P153DRAFT_395087 [Dothidotthia symphoricarpi CBS 119687]KAF2131780.1 hypothetical protein P153DRAFT_395087 [Dothidotthia symphoricarpi CBS 119687]
MLARVALSRLAADVPATSTHDVPQLARSLQRCLLARNALRLPATRAISRSYKAAVVHARRSYATTTTTARATKPTETVKKAVKAKVAEKPAPKKKAATTTKTRTKAAATPAKKPAAKKVAAKKPVAKKAAPKKAAPKKRAKRELTPEAKQTLKIRELKKIALKSPVAQSTLQGRHVFISEALSGSTSVTTGIADANAKWSAMKPAEVEHYNHLANEKNAARKAEYETWLASHTTEEIRAANNARSQLRRILPPAKNGNHAHTNKLHDDRQVKRPVNAYVLFFTDRRSSGDFKSISTTECAKLIGNEWKALTASEKGKYEAQAKEQAVAQA